MAAQFATNADLATRLGLTLTADEQSRADALLGIASGIIQQRMKQQIEYVADDTWTVRSTFDDRIRLPERPVLGVSSVTLTLMDTGETYTVPDETYYLDRDELVRTSFPLAFQYAFASFERGWLGPLYEMSVVYDHGFETVPEIVKAICMEMVVRVWVNPGSVARETVGNTATVYDNMRFSPSGLLFTDDEYQQLRDLIRRHSNTITLR